MAFIFMFSITWLIQGTSGLFHQKDVIDNLNSLQIIRKYGYPAEGHEVLTADGYLLQMHRIPYGRNGKSSDNKPPVLIGHGLVGSSASFLLLGPNDSLPFILADQGYDVWLGNFRGNTYSRAHVNLTPDNNRFWNFTWHESGVYDLPAKIDFIREHTKHDKIIYVGFSMGTTTFFVLTSDLPEYNDKILASYLMAPIVYAKNMENIMAKLLEFMSFYKIVEAVDEFFLHGEYSPENPILKKFQLTFCEPFKIHKSICKNLIFIVFGFDSEMLTDTTLMRLLGHSPAGYSVKGLTLYTQLKISGKFGRYDYGPKKNLQVYGSTQPPEYKLENIRVPLYFYIGKKDNLSTLPDINLLKKRLKSLKSEFVIEYPKFNHLDFFLSKDVKNQLYNKLIQDMESFLKNYKMN